MNNDSEAHDYTSDLMLFAYQNNLEKVKEALTHQVNVNAYNAESNTVLMLAAFSGNKEIVQILINHGANIHTTNAEIYEIVSQLNAQSYDYLSNTYPFVNVVGSCGTALSVAIRYGHYDIVKLLINHGANINISTDNPFIYAAGTGHCDIVKLMIEHGANINIIDQNYEQTALVNAVHGKDSDMVALLIHHGVNINTMTLYGKTAFFRAVECNHRVIMERLAINGASWEKDIDQFMAMNASIFNRNKLNDIMEKNPFSVAVAQGNILEATRLLNTVPEYLNQVDHFVGHTPLMRAVINDQTVSVKFLLEKGVDVDFTNEHEQTALVFAMRNWRNDGCRDEEGNSVLDLLLSYGPDLESAEQEIEKNKYLESEVIEKIQAAQCRFALK